MLIRFIFVVGWAINLTHIVLYCIVLLYGLGKTNAVVTLRLVRVRKIAVSVSVRLLVCLSVFLCLFTCLMNQNPNFLYVLPLAMAHCFCDGNAICYLLPILWMMSSCHNSYNGPVSQKTCYV